MMYAVSLLILSDYSEYGSDVERYLIVSDLHFEVINQSLDYFNQAISAFVGLLALECL